MQKMINWSKQKQQKNTNKLTEKTSTQIKLKHAHFAH